ncbi:MAG: hypothetical protein A4S14_21220 [Proteobacteria bacterium SG_bin9]|nr:MAG: hypothetical protein A4S14_21220 [Proteobacteria bacterium SG_bin9]
MRIAVLVSGLSAVAIAFGSTAVAQTLQSPPAPFKSLFSDIAPAANVRREIPLPKAAPPPEVRQKKTADANDQQVLRRQIGQMIMLGFPGVDPSEEWPQRIKAMLQDGSIGGVVLFSQNVIDPPQVRRLVSSLQPKDGQPPAYVCVDQEGGAIQRLTQAKGFTGLPSAAKIATTNPAVASRLYRGAATEMARLGVNCNFGPVVDLNVEANNPAIGRLGRSYGADPGTVVDNARMFIEAHKQAGVLTAAKHFPGHGSARIDPHDAVVDITRTWRTSELEPFQTIIDDDQVSMIMVGHLILRDPRFKDGDKPTSLSPQAIHQVLRTQLGFRGLVVSDDLDMGAIRNRYGVDEAAVMAIEAGTDIVIIANTKAPDPDLANRIIAKVMRAVEQGRIKREFIEQSYNRALNAKKQLTDRRAYVMH